LRALLLLLAACGGATNDPGYGTALAIAGAQFRPGAFPSANGGPSTQQVTSGHQAIAIGTFREKLHAVMAPDARAAIVGIVGQEGAWIVVAGPPDIDTPGQPTATATFGLDSSVTPGPFTLELAAVDGDGKIGEPATADLVADDSPPPDGDLVVGLVWDSTADLDIHVVDPLGGEAWSDKPNTLVPTQPGDPVDPLAYLASGLLDHDGNQACHRDASPNEHVIWKTRSGPNGDVAPVIPTGTYTVRVDTRSMCSDASAAWYVEVYAEGVLIGSARGVAVPDDVRDDHGYGAGVTALTFTQ
jgi:hypothetical protein